MGVRLVLGGSSGERSERVNQTGGQTGGNGGMQGGHQGARAYGHPGMYGGDYANGGHDMAMPPQNRQMGYLAPDFYTDEEMRRGRGSNGRFVHRASTEEDGPYGHFGSRRHYDDEMGHGSSRESGREDSAEKVHRLERRLRRLEERLEELEDGESGGSERKKKKERKSGDDDDDDDHARPDEGLAKLKGLSDRLAGIVTGKPFLAALPGVFEAAVDVIKSPPPTWPDYLKKSDYPGIVKMETGELLAALEEKKPLKDVRKELTHTVAALLQLCAQAAK